MRAHVESIKRLYKAGRITLERVKALVAEGKITPAEYDYITQ